MPNSRSAAKRLRQDTVRTLRNRIRKSRIKTFEKKFLSCVEAGDLDGARQNLSHCFSSLDKAAKVNTIHKNKANRKKSRLAARLKALDPAPTA